MTSPTKSIPADIARRLDQAGIPQNKQSEKVRSLWWYAPALLFLLFGLGFCGFGIVLVMRDQITVLKAVVLAVPAAACFFVTFYCATQASSEGLNAAIASVLTLGRGARAIAKGQEPSA